MDEQDRASVVDLLHKSCQPALSLTYSKCLHSGYVSRSRPCAQARLPSNRVDCRPLRSTFGLDGLSTTGNQLWDGSARKWLPSLAESTPRGLHEARG